MAIRADTFENAAVGDNGLETRDSHLLTVTNKRLYEVASTTVRLEPRESKSHSHTMR